MCLSLNHIFIARATGGGVKFDINNLNNFNIYHFDSRLMKIGASPNGNYFWGIDDADKLSVYNISKKQLGKPIFEKRDVWSVKWNEDEAEMNDKTEQADIRFVFLEKNKLIKNIKSIYKDLPNCFSTIKRAYAILNDLLCERQEKIENKTKS